MSLITADGLYLGYEGKTVIEDLNFSIENGEYLYIIGENGAGKSTLIKGILHLNKPMKGKIQYSDGLKPSEIGYLPQQTNIQKDFPASVYEVVLSGRLNSLGLKPFYTKRDKEAVKHNMGLMSIWNLRDRCYQDLSGGQQQRVLLARAMCATKKMILLDEPVAGLDPIVTTELYELISLINKEMGITVVMVSHDIRAAIDYADKILMLKHEDEPFYGTKEEFLKSKEYRMISREDD